jgi:hypothetical protein
LFLKRVDVVVGDERKHISPRGGGAELGGGCFNVALPVLAGEHRAATLTPVGCRRGAPGVIPSPVTIRTLADLIPARFKRTAVPSLEHRYRLAQALAIALFRLHLTGWLHKGIRSSNVVFLANPDDKDKSDLVRSPWLLGFD